MDSDDDDYRKEKYIYNEYIHFEKAKSGRSTCKGCWVKIADKELRVSHTMEYDYEYDYLGYPDTRNMHVKCFKGPCSSKS